MPLSYGISFTALFRLGATTRGRTRRLTETAAAMTTKSKTGRIVSMPYLIAVCMLREAESKRENQFNETFVNF
jgi:hypothetical protein